MYTPEFAFTDNGALSFSGSGSACVDFFFHAAKKRQMNEMGDALPLFKAAYSESPDLACVLLFQLRDIRGGQGEREMFKQMFAWLCAHDHARWAKLIPFVGEYGRWEELVPFVSDKAVVSLIRAQLDADNKTDKPSLLGKWMPSENAGKVSSALAARWIAALGMKPENYRKMLSGLRAKIKIVESDMSANRWGDINYSAVPSRANMLYKNAFERHDPARRSAFVARALEGAEKINSSTVYPYEIYDMAHDYGKESLAEAMWKNLPDFTGGQNALVIADVSASMTWKKNGRISPMAVSVSMALYFAERNRGPFGGYMMTFSEKPTLYAVGKGSLRDKIAGIEDTTWSMSTNIEAAFDAILALALKSKATQDDMPKKLYIISDMQFNDCTGRTNLQAAKAKFKTHGYTLPVVVFWNAGSTGVDAPAMMDDKGVVLAGGLSPSVFKSVVNADENTTPFTAVIGVANSERYLPIRKALGVGR